MYFFVARWGKGEERNNKRGCNLSQKRKKERERDL